MVTKKNELGTYSIPLEQPVVPVDEGDMLLYRRMFTKNAGWWTELES